MAWLDEVLRFIAHARKPDGALDECRLDAAGNLRVVVASDSAEETRWERSPGFASQHVVKSSSGKLLFLSGYAESGGYLHVFDASTVPTEPTSPALPPIALGWGASFSVPLPARGRVFKSGIVWAVSAWPDPFSFDPRGRVFASAEIV